MVYNNTIKRINLILIMEVLEVEKFDVYDSNGVKTELVLDKGHVLAEGQYKMAVNTWFVYDDKILIQKRAEGLKTGAGKWSATSGGAIAGENPDDTAVRECFEELGVKLNKCQLIQLGRVIDKNYIIYIYAVHMAVKIDDLVLQKSEVQEVDWKTLDDVERLIKADEYFGNMRAWRNIKIYVDFWNKFNKMR